MLTAGGTYVEDVPLDGAAWLTYVRSPHAHARIAQHRCVRGASRVPVSSPSSPARTSPSSGWRPTPTRRSPRACGGRSSPPARCATSANRSSPSSPRIARGRRRRRPRRHRLRAAARRHRPGGRGGRRGAAVPRRRLQRGDADGVRDDGRLQRLRGGRRRAHRQPADDRRADRGSLRRRLLDRRRAPRALLGVPGRAPDPRPADPGVRPRAGAGPGHRPRRGRRLRGQVADVSGGAGPGLLRPRAWGGRCDGRRHGRRTWSPCPTAGARCSTPRSAARGTGGSPPTSSTSCRMPAPSRWSARSCRWSPCA